MKKAIKFVFNFQPMRNFYPHATWGKVFLWRLGRSVRNVFILGMFVATGYVSAKAYNELNPKTVYADREVIKEVETNIPVLSRIAKCESNNNQFDSNGQVLMRPNENGSVDSGVMQINLTIWGKQAKLLGYDLTQEKDNRDFGKWLFINYGSDPWGASRNCWSKR